jgi:putative transposase
VERWLTRFEAEHCAGLMDHKRGPKAPRKRCFPVMVAVYHLQKRHPDAGEFRIWSLLGNTEISVRTVGRIMALNQQVDDDIPHGRKPGPTPTPHPHPDKACRLHEDWFIDGRRMDCALEGGKWWSLLMWDGDSRTMLAGAPVEASWVALMVLSTACLRYGVPQALISDSGGAFTSHECAAVCTRLQINHEPMESTKGESYQNLMETHFNIQRRLFDSQFSLTTTPLELEPAHQACMELYNTTAHQGLMQDHFDPPIPLAVLGEAKGRVYRAEERSRKFSHALCPRTTHLYGCVPLHSYHCYIEAGLPKTQVFLWVYGEQLRAVFDNVVVAEYRCRYDWRTHKVKDIREGVFDPTRYASLQGVLLPFDPHESLVWYRPQFGRRPTRSSARERQ